MKTETTDYAFQTLITYLLPGIIAAFAVIVWHGVTEKQLEAMIKFGKDAQFLASLAIISIVTLAGALIASIQAALETWILDRITPALIGISRQDFNKQWSNYISNLNEYKNSYISRVVLFFQFETRIGLSTIVLGIALFRISWPHAIVVIIIGLVFYSMGISHHKELGEYRVKNCA
ncbi:MAG: hypothetical protein KUF79_17505 [Candidatus Thiodiazotropha sp. (ex Ctena orbiculata)]|nr:hypothetical protein [Candidatus Thiodiazotropha taylori]